MRAGFVIANLNEEFLAYAEAGTDITGLLWSTHPGDALIFEGYKYARIVADQIQKNGNSLFVLQMIETDQTCFLTVPVGRMIKGPEWLKVA